MIWLITSSIHYVYYCVPWHTLAWFNPGPTVEAWLMCLKVTQVYEGVIQVHVSQVHTCIQLEGVKLNVYMACCLGGGL